MKKLLFLFAIFSAIFTTLASHIKAGEIIIKSNPSNAQNFTFSFILYYDATNITTNPNQSGLIDVSFINVSMGDGSLLRSVDLTERVDFTDQNIAKCTYSLSYTYGKGDYTISFSESWRIGGILNMSRSGETDLHIDAKIRINPSYGLNSSPILTFPPLDQASRGKIYTHNPGAYDPDGDSLVFELIPPTQKLNTNVNDYTSPADPKFGGVNTDPTQPPSFDIDRKTGEITWNTPGKEGFYNIAIKISEYRRGVFLGYIIRDMQIKVSSGPNMPPIITSEDEACIEAGKAGIIDFQVTDPNLGDNFHITSYGSAFAQPNSKPIFVNLPNVAPNPYLNGIISWTASCASVREQPYQILLKAEEANLAPSLRLSNIKTISIKVRAPKPVWKTIDKTADDKIKLSWETYSTTCARAETLKIYRAECDSIINFDCPTGKLSGSNYQLIGSVKPNISEFIDDNKGVPFKSNVKYFYTIIATFPQSARGISFPAEPKSIIFANKALLIKSVNVLNKNTIELSWSIPDLSNTTPNYGYEIFRSTDNKSFVSILSKPNLPDLSDNQYIDNTVDLSKNNYYYKIKFYVNNDPTKLDSSATASNIILSYKPLTASAELSWSGAIPYNIYKVKIFDFKTNTYIDSVSGSNSYIIKDLKSCDSSEYLVTTYQKYCISASNVFYTSNSYKIKVTPLVDKSTKFDLKILNSYCDKIDCSEDVPLPVYDTLVWPDLRRLVCSNVVGYTVYFKSILEQDFKLLDTVLTGTNPDTMYISPNSVTRVGCYMVKLLTKDQNNVTIESSTSNTACVLNDCYCFKVPNVMTPNGDNMNDLLTPLKYPRFLKSLKFSIYNRWGTKVFETTDLNINWDAKNVGPGVYYYSAEITKYSLDGNDKDEVKGHVTVLK